MYSGNYPGTFIAPKNAQNAETKRQSGAVPIPLLALSASTTSAYSSLGVSQESNPHLSYLRRRSNHSATSAVSESFVQVVQRGQPPRVRFYLAQMQQGLGNGQDTAATCPQNKNAKLMRCRNKDNGSGCLLGQHRNHQLHAAPRRLLLRDCRKPVLLSREGQGAFCSNQKGHKVSGWLKHAGASCNRRTVNG